MREDESKGVKGAAARGESPRPDRVDGGPVVGRARREGLQCERCALADHEADAMFCRRCGEELPSS
jgi:uncharacterized paraquat-inducible protein A